MCRVKRDQLRNPSTTINGLRANDNHAGTFAFCADINTPWHGKSFASDTFRSYCSKNRHHTALKRQPTLREFFNWFLSTAPPNEWRGKWVPVFVWQKAFLCRFTEVPEGFHFVNWVTVSVSAQDGNVALGKACTRSAPSPGSFPKVAFETVPGRVECRPLPFSTHLSFKRSVLWCSGLSMFRKFLKHLGTSTLPSCRPDVVSAVFAGLSARSFPLTSACPGH